jgi:beta-lactamase regulating signal transducer with metallopeptidase domain
MTIFISWLFQAMLSTALMILVVICLCRMFRDRPSLQHALWLVVLVKFVTPPLVSLPVGVPTFVREWALYDSVAAATSNNAIPVTETDSIYELDEQIALSDFAEPGLVDNAVTSGSPSTTSVASNSAQPAWRTKVIPGLFLVWLVGTIAIVVRHVSQVRRQFQLIRNASPASDQLTRNVAEVAQRMRIRPLPTSVASGIASPFVWCFGRLQLIWPQPMTDPAFEPTSRSIIAHELSHVRRHDHWIAWLEMAASLVWWWNPLFWFVCRQIRTSAEMACDAIALATYPEDRSVYAETLVALSVSKTGVPALGLAVGAGTPSSLERRITMMMSEHVSSKLSLPGFLALILLGLAAIPAWSLAQEATNDDAIRVTETSDENGNPVRADIGSRRVTASRRVTETKAAQGDPEPTGFRDLPLEEQKSFIRNMELRKASGLSETAILRLKSMYFAALADGRTHIALLLRHGLRWVHVLRSSG